MNYIKGKPFTTLGTVSLLLGLALIVGRTLYLKSNPDPRNVWNLDKKYYPYVISGTILCGLGIIFGLLAIYTRNSSSSMYNIPVGNMPINYTQSLRNSQSGVGPRFDYNGNPID
jgi:hypothetical protein